MGAAIKALWVFIKKHKLNAGRVITPNDTLKKVLPVAKVDMLKMAGMVASTCPSETFREFAFVRARRGARREVAVMLQRCILADSRLTRSGSRTEPGCSDS